MAQTTETELRELRDLILGLREEMRVGFANTDTKFAEIKGEIQRVEAKTDIKFVEIKGEIQQVTANTDIKFAESKAITGTQFADLHGEVKVIAERTKLGFWGFVWRAIVIAVLVSLLSAANKFVFGGGLGSLGL